MPRKIYRGFATYLAEQGFATMTYDYRGIGGSRPETLKGFAARMRDWASLDVAGAIDHLRGVWPQLPLAVVGHSFGGQAVGLVPNNGEISRALFVAAQAGHWRLIRTHLLPNVLPTVIIIATLQAAQFILAEAALSFLGLGLPPAIPSWGTIMNQGRPYIEIAWWVETFSGLAIALLVTGVGMLGNWTRDVLDPRLRR